jgi:hypothetical protein
MARMTKSDKGDRASANGLASFRVGLVRRRAARRHLCRHYEAGPPFVWRLYADASIFGCTNRPGLRARDASAFGAVMNDQSQENNRNPYSPAVCIALLLGFGAATQLGALASWF